MTALPKRRLTEAEYLAIERAAQCKSEYLDGEMFAMAGASERHGTIAGNIFASIHAQFRGRSCRVYTHDLRVRVADTGFFTYPDVIASCGEPRLTGERPDTLLNPQVIFEVLSPTTEAFDRGEKFSRYGWLESLTDYVLVSQDKMLVEHFTRQVPGDRWLLVRTHVPQDVVQIASISCELRLADIYDKVEFSPESAAPPR